jgi:hypothetical protein
VKELRWHKATHFTDHLFLVSQMELQKPRQFFFSFGLIFLPLLDRTELQQSFFLSNAVVVGGVTLVSLRRDLLGVLINLMFRMPLFCT